MARNAGRCFSMQTPSNETDTKPTNVRVEENQNNRNTNRAEWAGFIFLCDESTKIDCFKYRVLGLSDERKNLMNLIVKGTCLFLFDIKLRLLYGIYVASSCRTFQLEPDAFGGNFPWQVKFHIEKDCLPLSEHVFKAAIKNNYYDERRFKTGLSAVQVHKLVSMFSPQPGGPVPHPTACTNATSFVETDGCSQDTHSQRYLPLKPSYDADKSEVSIRSDAFREPTCPFNDSGNTEKCTHGYHTPEYKHMPPLLPAHVAKSTDGYMQSDHLHMSNQKPVVTEKCMHSYHAPNAKHGFLAPTCTCVADKADGFNQSRPVSWSNHELILPLNDVMSQKCTHGYYAARANHCFLPLTPASAAMFTHRCIQSDSLLRINHTHHDPTHILDDDAFITERCMDGYHAPIGKYEQMCLADDPVSLAQHCKVDHDAYLSPVKGRLISPGHNHSNPSCGPLCAICSSFDLQMTESNRIRTRADLHPGHTCGNPAAHINSSVYKQRHPTANAIQGNLLDRKLNMAEPSIDSSLCQHVEIALKSPQNPGVSDALPEEYCKAIAQKRSLQENYARANVSNASGERPPQCMYHHICRIPLDDCFGVKDAVTPNGYKRYL